MNDAIKSILKRFVGYVGNSLPVRYFPLQLSPITAKKNHTMFLYRINHV
jgi:hypothetical protein